MIQQWYVRGDTHGNFNWLGDYSFGKNSAIIILGDAGINFWLNNKDKKLKEYISSFQIPLYCVRGNHEARPSEIKGMQVKWDEEVHGFVWVEPAFPYIRYFMDYGIYRLGIYKVAVIGGAYSVDKWYRLYRAGVRDKLSPDYLNPKKTGWFPHEQLTTEEMNEAAALFKGQTFDFVLSHTCPIDWEPRDLFLNMVDQSLVDKTMELWLQEIKETFTGFIWLFGHYHADRIERPHVEQYFNNIESLSEIFRRWSWYDATGKLDWWLNKSPNFYQK